MTAATQLVWGTDYVESSVEFDCGGERLLGILSRPAADGHVACGVLIIVGGPQYRVGSHRQFVLLARRLAAAGIATFRFDYRGMGDSSGALRSFENVDEDVAAALDAFERACPGLQRITLWGLCDAASVALLYWQKTRDARVAGLCLLNPWVRSDATLARAHVKHYYGQRLLQAEFWRKLLRGDMNLLGALGGLLKSVHLWLGAEEGGEGSAVQQPFQSRMALALREFSGPVLLILSGDDYTAKEFIECADADAPWAGVLGQGNILRRDFPRADHTFSDIACRIEAESATLEWLQSAVESKCDVS